MLAKMFTCESQKHCWSVIFIVVLILNNMSKSLAVIYANKW